MEIILLFAVILVLVCVIIGLVLFLKKKHKDFDEMIEDYQIKATASISEMENKLKEKNNTEVEEIKKSYETKMNDYKEYIHSIEQFSKSPSEINTYKILTEIKKKLVLDRKIDPLQMKLLANVFVPFKSKDGEIHSAKIDHLVIMNTGIYIIATKDWQGNVLYGISKEKAQGFPFIHDNFYTADDKETEKTIVYSTRNHNRDELKVVSIEEPSKQVMAGYRALNDLLEEHIDQVQLTPILYIDHDDNKLTNYSQNVVPHVFDQMDSLYEFFVKELENRRDGFSIVEIEEIKNLIENVHITA